MAAERADFAVVRASPAYAAAMAAPTPPAPRTGNVVSISMFALGAVLVGLGLALDERSVLTIGFTLSGFAVVLFVMYAKERAKAKLPVARELVAIIACTQETKFIDRGDLSRSARARIDVCEVEYEDGTRSRLEVCVRALTRTIRSGTLELPVMAVVVTRGDELHGWHPIAPG